MPSLQLWFFNQKKKIAMLGSEKLGGETKTEWEGICMAVRPFHCVHADDGLVLVQVTVSLEAC